MKTYDVFLCHSTRHDADTATENTMAMVYVLLKDQLGSRPRGQARRGGDPRRLRPGPPARARDRHAPELRGRTAAARAGRQVAPAEGISWASPITPAWSRRGGRCVATGMENHNGVTQESSRRVRRGSVSRERPMPCSSRRRSSPGDRPARWCWSCTPSAWREARGRRRGPPK